MCAKRKKKKSFILRFLILGVSVYMITILASLYTTLAESRAELAKLQQQYATQQAEVEQLQALLENGSQKDIIEKAARERLGYVYSDEEIFIDISGN